MKAPGSPSSALQIMILFFSRGASAYLPFFVGREPGSSSSSEPRVANHPYDFLGRFFKCLHEPHIPFVRQVMVDFLGVYEAAISENHPNLRLEHRQVKKTRKSTFKLVGVFTEMSDGRLQAADLRE